MYFSHSFLLISCDAFLFARLGHFTTGGWNIFEQSSSNHQWSLFENLPIVQVNFGVHPFFKVSIEDGNITLSEGELGLPDEQLYFLHRDHPVKATYLNTVAIENDLTMSFP